MTGDEKFMIDLLNEDAVYRFLPRPVNPSGPAASGGCPHGTVLL